MPDVTGFINAAATLTAPMVLAGAVALVRRVHQNSTAIRIIQEKMTASDTVAENRHKENREDLMEIKAVVRDVQRHLMNRA